MRRLVRIFFAIIFLVQISVGYVWAQDETFYYFFYGQGCGHCARVEQYFQENDIYDHYSIEKKEIYYDETSRELFNALLEERNIPLNKRGVPTLVFGDTVIVGDKPIIEYFSNEGESMPDNQASENENSGSTLTLPLVIGASLVDAINPCAFAVLIILISTVLTQAKKKNRRKILHSGIAFSSSIFLSYLLMGLGLYRAIATIENSTIIFTVVGVIAIILGLLNIKDYFYYGKGVLMEVPLSWRPALKKTIGSVTSVKGAFVVGFLVSLFLLPCTSGPYIVILGLLSQKVYFTKAFGYLLLYNLIFVSPMIVLTYVFYKGLSPEKIESVRQKRLRVLHLIAGLLLLAMGVVVLMQ